MLFAFLFGPVTAKFNFRFRIIIFGRHFVSFVADLLGTITKHLIANGPSDNVTRSVLASFHFPFHALLAWLGLERVRIYLGTKKEIIVLGGFFLDLRFDYLLTANELILA